MSWRRLRQVAVPVALLSTVGVAVSAILTGVAAYWLFDLLARVRPSRRGRRLDGRRRGLRHAPFHPHPAPARAPARGGVGRQRPDGDRAHARTDRVDREQPDDYGVDDLLRAQYEQGSGSASSSASGSAWSRAGVRAHPALDGAFAPVASVAAGALSFGAADVIGGSGFLSHYIVGLAVGSTLRSVTDDSWSPSTITAQDALFIVLGLLVFPSDLLEVALPGLALSFILMLVILTGGGLGGNGVQRSDRQ